MAIIIFDIDEFLRYRHIRSQKNYYNKEKKSTL